jgi:hypothetical protein
MSEKENINPSTDENPQSTEKKKPIEQLLTINYQLTWKYTHIHTIPIAIGTTKRNGQNTCLNSSCCSLLCSAAFWQKINGSII